MISVMDRLAGNNNTVSASIHPAPCEWLFSIFIDFALTAYGGFIVPGDNLPQ
jgi:hypothetical protein